MLVESDSKKVRLLARDLYKVFKQTNYDGALPTEPEKITQALNDIVSRLAFHEMRLHATEVLIEDITDCLARLLRKGVTYDRSVEISDSFHERLSHLRTEQRALLLEVSRNQKVAQNQLEIVYNLVVQRANRKTHEMAEIQRRIAVSTMDDSFAMRTIAVMSIAFLPATFVSSFFSMSMFNWQAPAGTPIVSSRFWMSWAVTLPLTLVVFSIWFSWQHHHHQKETPNNVDLPDTGDTVRDDPLRDALPARKLTDVHRWLEKRRHKAESVDEEQHVEPGTSGRSVLVADALATTPSIRVPVTTVLRADTSVPAPRMF
jgi:hypothetical protein